MVILDWLKEFQGVCSAIDTGENVIPWNQLPRSWVDKKEFYDIHTWLDEAWMSAGTVKEQYEVVTTEFDKLLLKHGYSRDDIIYKCEKNVDKTIVIFCHFALGMVLVSHLCGISPVL